ncbi:hypothetical protein A9Q99_01190 [Gammaproteobacteria bacterium 45_16_T64]|nr:hypothetical protein A9Q99_01190 [Gammaproteobacteria bacterium 45_16_T64]
MIAIPPNPPAFVSQSNQPASADLGAVEDQEVPLSNTQTAVTATQEPDAGGNEDPSQQSPGTQTEAILQRAAVEGSATNTSANAPQNPQPSTSAAALSAYQQVEDLSTDDGEGTTTTEQQVFGGAIDEARPQQAG